MKGLLTDMEKTLSALYKGMDEIFGLPEDEMKNNGDLNLFETGLVDSLGIVSLISYTENRIGYKINFKDMNPNDFSTVNRLAAAIAAQKP